MIEEILFIILWVTALVFAAIPDLGRWLHAHIVVMQTEMETYLKPNSLLRRLVSDK